MSRSERPRQSLLAPMLLAMIHPQLKVDPTRPYKGSYLRKKGSGGVNMSAHNAKQASKRHRQNQIARVSRRRNRR